MIRFKANGKMHELPQPVCVDSFLKDINLNPGSVIVEYNREFLSRNSFNKKLIQDGDTLEIIRVFAGG